MRLIFLITPLLFCLSLFGQQKPSELPHTRTFKGESMVAFLDSLIADIYSDTSQFRRDDLLHTNTGTRNSKPYSPVYIVNMKYAYKLDIINGTLVNEFVNNILNPSIIDSIEVLDIPSSQVLYGVSGLNGAILITTKRNANVKYTVAGLTKKKHHKQGNNFNQRQAGEVKILY